jgi:hypothetical protein
MKQLRLEHAGNMYKQSYVRLKHTYQVEISKLRTFAKKCRAYKLRLDEKSYGILMGELGLVKETWEDTNTLYETKSRRLRVLANSNSNPRQIETIPRSVRTSSGDLEGLGYYITEPFRLSSQTLVHQYQNRTHQHISPSHAVPATPQHQSTLPPESRLYFNALSERLNSSGAPPRGYGTLYTPPRSDPYASSWSFPQSGYVPPSPPSSSDSDRFWPLFTCLVGFLGVGGLVWRWYGK